MFGEDEERSRPDGKRAAVGSILIDREGYVLEDNGIAVSSFAWALRPALDLKLGRALLCRTRGALRLWFKFQNRLVTLE
ncbi:hypothetical protein D9M68_931410 [compost metagenome]